MYNHGMEMACRMDAAYGLDRWKISETKIIIHRSGINGGIRAMTSILDKPFKGVLMENSSEDKIDELYVCVSIDDF